MLTPKSLWEVIAENFQEAVISGACLMRRREAVAAREVEKVIYEIHPLTAAGAGPAVHPGGGGSVTSRHYKENDNHSLR